MRGQGRGRGVARAWQGPATPLSELSTLWGPRSRHPQACGNAEVVTPAHSGFFLKWPVSSEHPLCPHPLLCPAGETRERRAVIPDSTAHHALGAINPRSCGSPQTALARAVTVSVAVSVASARVYLLLPGSFPVPLGPKERGPPAFLQSTCPVRRENSHQPQQTAVFLERNGSSSAGSSPRTEDRGVRVPEGNSGEQGSEGDREEANGEGVSQQ